MVRFEEYNMEAHASGTQSRVRMEATSSSTMIGSGFSFKQKSTHQVRGTYDSLHLVFS